VNSKLYKAAHLFLLAALIAVIVIFGWPLYLRHAENSSLETLARYPHEITAVEVLRLSDTDASGPAGSYLVRYDKSHAWWLVAWRAYASSSSQTSQTSPNDDAARVKPRRG